MTLGSSESERRIKLRPPLKPPKKENGHLISNPTTNANPNPNLDTIQLPMPAGEGSSGDAALRGSQFLSREEVLRRRSHRAKKLLRVYQRHYWALVDEIRVKHRDYYWENGKSPLEGEEDENGNGEDGERKLCGFVPCKSKAMPLTRFCHQHILTDGNQRLYKACAFVTKCAQGVHITCGKPVLRATVPSLCPGHHQKFQKQISTALKKAGVNSSIKLAPKVHVLIGECVREIQGRRRKALNATRDADKPHVSSLKIINRMGPAIIRTDIHLPVDGNCTELGGLLRENHTEVMMDWNPSQAHVAGSMATVTK